MTTTSEKLLVSVAAWRRAMRPGGSSMTLTTCTPPAPQDAPDLGLVLERRQVGGHDRARERIGDHDVGAVRRATGEQLASVAEPHAQAALCAQVQQRAQRVEDGRSFS